MPEAPLMPPQALTDVTFKGRGLGRMLGLKLALLICPRCSQRNAPKVEAKGYCNWCCYEPSREDAEPAPFRQTLPTSARTER